MLLKQYDESGLLFYSNFLEETSTSGLWGYRGDLVLVPGAAADEKGHTLPPQSVMRAAVLLADTSIKMMLGGLDDIANLPVLIEKYQSDFAEEMKAMLFVVNINSPAVIEVGSAVFFLIPLVQGVPWNECMEELALEKGDFKGQSPADKLVTMYENLKTYKPKKYGVKAMADVLADLSDAKREIWGAV